MAVEPPFIYDRASSYAFNGPTSRGFNPRAATQASWAPKQPKPKQDGPLINFNRHPDSYVQSPYGNTTHVPMNPKTKERVKLAWRMQRALRLLALLAALGTVFCIVTIRNTSTAVGWIIRAGPAVALVHTLYATYFLCRGINSRPPASCAGYQMFAALVDTGLLPFFVISCYMTAMEHTSNQYGWSTLFKDDLLDHKIIQSFMILCAVEGGLFAISLIIDVYLAVVYRKITRMPPDANPLAEQDNLTGAGRKHKRNKSELVYEKHLSASTAATERFSQMTRVGPSGRRVPFKHTRTDSADSESFSTQKDFLDEVRAPYSAQGSTSPARDNPALSRPSSAVIPAANARPAGAGLEYKPTRSSGLARTMSPGRPNSWLSYSDYEGMPANLSHYYQQELEDQNRTMSPVSAMSDHENHHVRRMPYQTETYPPITALAQQPAIHFDQENGMPSPEQLSLALPPAYTPPKKRSREPLGMNPPTPVNQRFNDEGLVPRPLSMIGASTPPRQALHEAESNSVLYHTPASSRPAPPSRPASFVGSGTKARFYGNLRTSVGGSPTRNAHDEFDFDLQRSATTKSSESGNFEVYASASESDNSSDDDYDPYNSRIGPQHGAPVVIGELSPGRQWNIGNHRQVSNSTGHDLHNGYAGLDSEFANTIPRRREVSGKVAEEGRNYQFSTSTAELQTKPGAAGWARFKGL